MGHFYKHSFLIIFTTFLAYSPSSFGQDSTLAGTKLIDAYLVENQFKKADSALQSQVSIFKKKNQLDSLHQYPYYVGKIENAKGNTKTAIPKAETFLDALLASRISPRSHYKALTGMSFLYEELGEIQKSFDAAIEARDIVLNMKDATYDEKGEVYYGAGYCYYIQGNFVEGNVQNKKALENFSNSKEKNHVRLSDVNNFIGIVMWRSQKLDSAHYYLEKAIDHINQTKKDSLYKLYATSGTKLNLALVTEARGNITEAMQTLEQLIKDCSYLVKNSKDTYVINRSQRLLLTGVSNLSSLNNHIGKVNRALELSQYVYNNRDKIYAPNDPEIVRSLILLGQSQESIKEIDKAIKSFEEALQLYENNPAADVYWSAIAHSSLASCYALKGKTQLAETTYEKAEKLYKQALGDNLDDTYLSFARDKAMFLANTNKKEEAIATALNAFHYLKENGGENNIDLIVHYLNVAKVYYTVKEYTRSLEWSEAGLFFVDNFSKNKETELDALSATYRKPLLLLEHSRALYAQNNTKDSVFLKKMLHEMGEAFKVLEGQKALVSQSDNVNALYANFSGLYDFTKQLYLDLYAETHTKKYLTKVIETHEKSMYYNIRSKLMLQDNISFGEVPKAIIKREGKLKKAAILGMSPKDSAGTIEDFVAAKDEYDSFLDSLKTAYPKYYKMKFAPLDASLQNLQKFIPKNTTVLRYLFIDGALFGIVLDKENSTIVPLKFEKIKGKIELLNTTQFSIEEESTLLYELYQQLWEPLISKIHNKKVIIIPDSELFNLSFETLTPSRIKSYKELATTSLLAKYSISYNFSLLLLDEDKKPRMFSENFVAFAPGFSTKMKTDYSISVTDSIHNDGAYLTLLPQPNSVELAENYSRIFKGKSFLNENSTKQIFEANAGEHKIIHIGTHAESNNVSPEFSRLIFAKKNSGNESYDANSLYTYEIYNTNLSSNLAILTACETGKPTYQPGEGMISLAHAFNYAGSESILTSLWQIDEESSTKIIQFFYDNLAEGLDKDEALRQAKLAYLAAAEGRTAAPQYWAGLVLIGDTSPVDLQTGNSIWWWVLGIGLIILLLYMVFVLRKNNLKQYFGINLL
ncbi:CHAT domain-containing protein [Rasiella sp. SM2506]|uniref:CHAT domain-containing protein n=1 Tax=Rasiella sp. SM2506 TaxID=3423914 RepID=UPI003D7BA417